VLYLFIIYYCSLPAYAAVPLLTHIDTNVTQTSQQPPGLLKLSVRLLVGPKITQSSFAKQIRVSVSGNSVSIKVCVCINITIEVIGTYVLLQKKYFTSCFFAAVAVFLPPLFDIAGSCLQKWYRQQCCLLHTNGKLCMWSILEWITLSGFGNKKKHGRQIKVLPPPRVNGKWHSRMDRILDMLFVHQKHTEAAQMVKRQVWGRDRERSCTHATPAFILRCMASCYSNMTSHSFSPAVFDQFSLMRLPQQPSFVLKYLTTAAGLSSVS